MPSSEHPDLVVVGDGIVGLACARALRRAGMRPLLLGHRREGRASPAAGGFLAPTIEATHGGALDFALAARDGYRRYLEELREQTGLDVPLHLDGILRLAASEEECAALRRDEGLWAHWLQAHEVGVLEPALHAPFGGLLHPSDGLADNVALLEALERALALDGVPHVVAGARRLEFVPGGVTVHTTDGGHLSCAMVVLAAGAWAPLVEGLPTPLPVFPLRGQMLALVGIHVSRPVYARGLYLAPRFRQGVTIVGSTSEDIGFQPGTTADTIARFEEVARRLLPSTDHVRADAWSGLRPMTPDGLPILGVDRTTPSLIYACGHSRNGILLAPLTGDVVARLAAGSPPGFDLSPFRADRFH